MWLPESLCQGEIEFSSAFGLIWRFSRVGNREKIRSEKQLLARIHDSKSIITRKEVSWIFSRQGIFQKEKKNRMKLST
jgi:hypothetical protein